MIPRYVRDCVKLLPQITVILMVVFPTSGTKQCRSSTAERDGPVIIRNVGIKLCELKCDESGQCLSTNIQYNIDTLSCRLLRDESRKTKSKEEIVSLAKNNPDVPTGFCASKVCSFGQRCLKTRSGKSVCVQEEEQNVSEKSPHHEVDKEETFLSSPLHNECKKGNLSRVRLILSQAFVDVNSRDGNHGKTPLMVAAQEGHCQIVSLLIGKGANMSQVDNDGKNILHWTCKGGHVDMVECLLPQYGVDINNKHVTPLMQAAWRGFKDVCEFLVCMGANVSQVKDDGENVIHSGCKGGHLGMVKYLLSLCLDINRSGKGGMTPLMAAASWGHRDICEYLVSAGANMLQVDDDGNNVLHIASKTERVYIMKSLLSQDKVDINCRGQYGWTPLMTAAYYGKRNMFDLLANKGGLTHLVDDQGRNILHLASSGRKLQMVKRILSRKMVDITARDKDGKTAAMIAKHDSERHIYKLLVSRGCPVK